MMIISVIFHSQLARLLLVDTDESPPSSVSGSSVLRPDRVRFGPVRFGPVRFAPGSRAVRPEDLPVVRTATRHTGWTGKIDFNLNPTSNLDTRQDYRGRGAFRALRVRSKDPTIRIWRFKKCLRVQQATLLHNLAYLLDCFRQPILLRPGRPSLTKVGLEQLHKPVLLA